MVAEVVSVNETPQAFGRWPQVDLRFRLVSTTTATKQSGQSALSVSVSTQAAHDAMGRPSDIETALTVSKDQDFYTELKKLGELKEKGLLTDEEFQREKQRLLDARTQ